MEQNHLYITEILDEINKNPSSLGDYKYMSPIDALLKYAFDKNLKMKLKEGAVLFNPSTEPMGFCPSTLTEEYKRYYVFLNENISEERREILFIQMLEKIHPDEAKVLILVKDQNLEMVYPNITRELLIEYGVVEKQEGGVENERIVTNVFTPTTPIEETLDFVSKIKEYAATIPTDVVEQPKGGIIENLTTEDSVSIVLNSPTVVEWLDDTLDDEPVVSESVDESVEVTPKKRGRKPKPKSV